MDGEENNYWRERVLIFIPLMLNITSRANVHIRETKKLYD